MRPYRTSRLCARAFEAKVADHVLGGGGPAESITGEQGHAGGARLVIRTPVARPPARGWPSVGTAVPGNGRAVVLGENGLVRPVVLVPGQRPGVRATARGPLSAGGAGLQVRVLGAVIWGASGAQDPEALSVCAGHRPAGLLELDCYCVRIYSSTCASSRMRTCAHGSGDHGRRRRRTHSDLENTLPSRLPGRCPLATLSRRPERRRAPGLCRWSAHHAREPGRSGLVRSCPARSGCLPLTCTSTRLGAFESQKVRKYQG